MPAPPGAHGARSTTGVPDGSSGRARSCNVHNPAASNDWPPAAPGATPLPPPPNGAPSGTPRPRRARPRPAPHRVVFSPREVSAAATPRRSRGAGEAAATLISLTTLAAASSNWPRFRSSVN
ncbi:ran-binding protein 9-like [Plodia interpunctella]|uniref:ran-binding protein 9-like n=1 Tax=Plodia interpunctella TaxID=58824 RepID=UPI0023689F23|nr:ran-binding protein 9-like [Plodia interpunctella]